MDRKRAKLAYRKLFARVSEILMRDWDPIGVSLQPFAEGEYDRYAGRICSRLFDPASTPAELAKYLEHVRVDWMGLHPPGTADIERMSQALMELKREFLEPAGEQSGR